MSSERPSLTATLVAGVRALYAAFPEPLNIAPDADASALVPPLIGLPVSALRSLPRAARTVHRALGVATLGWTYHVALRTRAIDEALRAGLAAGATQVVLLGAGLDNRARRLPELASVAVFEVDHPTVQRHKRERLSDLRPERTGVRFVAVDFERTALRDALAGAGLAPDRPSFWIWEGVTMYLTPDAIRHTLADVRALSAPGSRIALTYGTPDGLAQSPIAPLGHLLMSRIGEPIRWLVPPAGIRTLLEDAGFALLSDEGPTDWAGRYWPERPPGVRQWERLAVAFTERGA